MWGMQQRAGRRLWRSLSACYLPLLLWPSITGSNCAALHFCDRQQLFMFSFYEQLLLCASVIGGNCAALCFTNNSSCAALCFYAQQQLCCIELLCRQQSRSHRRKEESTVLPFVLGNVMCNIYSRSIGPVQLPILQGPQANLTVARQPGGRLKLSCHPRLPPKHPNRLRGHRQPL